MREIAAKALFLRKTAGKLDFDDWSGQNSLSFSVSGCISEAPAKFLKASAI